MKKIIYVILPILTFFSLTIKAEAAASLSAPSSVTNGSSFTVTANVSGVAAWEVHVKASGPVSGCAINVADSDANANNTSRSFSTTCKATGTGTIKITMSGNTTTASGATANISGSRTVTVNNKTTSSSSSSNKNSSSSNKNSSNSSSNNSNNNKSNDNTLKSLSVEGGSINFNKDMTTYTISVGNDINKIKINAEANNSKATVTGTGEKDVKEGDNKFDIVVTAENGDKKTYTINVNVDSKPITVTINGKKYTLIKKKEEMPELNIEHEDLTLNFEGQDVPAYRIDKINFVLVALRDEKGNIKLYKYDSYKDNEKPDKYTLFRQFTLPQMLVSYLEFPKKLIPEGYKKYTEEINGEKVTVYKTSKNSNYSLFYGINIETGKKHIYRYDKRESTMQIYEQEKNPLKNKMEEYEYAIVGLVGMTAILLLIIVLQMSSKRKFKKKILQKIQNKENSFLD